MRSPSDLLDSRPAPSCKVGVAKQASASFEARRLAGSLERIAAPEFERWHPRAGCRPRSGLFRSQIYLAEIIGICRGGPASDPQHSRTLGTWAPHRTAALTVRAGRFTLKPPAPRARSRSLPWNIDTSVLSRFVG